MGAALKTTYSPQITTQQPTKIVEVVGPAGAGKTTLFDALQKNIPRIQTAFQPDVRNPRFILFFFRHILSLVPLFIRLRGNDDRKLTRQEIAWMAILNGWPELLKKEILRNNKMLLIDQGPIFMMTILSEFGPLSLRSARASEWRQRMCELWAHTLDVVIWLDTSDETLTERIRSRQKNHLVKGEKDQTVHEFLFRCRVMYDHVIHQLTADNRRIQVFQFDTGRCSLDELVHEVTSLINIPG